LILLVIAGCGHHAQPLGDDGSVDGGGGEHDDAGADASGDGGDGGGGRSSGDGGDGGLDPAACVVGLNDGCCPTNVAYGGSDPDCADLGCASIDVSDPIPLDSDWQPYGISGVGMAWTGHELVLAWTPPVGSPAIVYERRDKTGALTFGPVVNADAATAANRNRATPELGFEPTTKTILYASSKLYRRYVETLDGNGAPASPARMIGVDCHPIMARYQIYPWQGEFLVAQNNDPCSGSEWHGARVDRIGTDGTHVGYSLGDQGIHQIGMTFDAENGRIVFSGGNQYLSVRRFAPPSTWAPPQMLLNVSTYNTGVSVGGGGFFVGWGDYKFNANQQITSDPWWSRWTISAMGATSSTRTPAMLTTGAHRQTIAPRLVWTGNGWIVLSSSFPWEHQGLPDTWASFSTFGWSFAPDGTLRSAFELDPLRPTYLVNAIWAGDRVAITYVTDDDDHTHERRYLRYLTCQP
jgi:hypothetical protein